MKINIKIPILGLNTKQEEETLKNINDKYNDKYTFEKSEDDKIHFSKLNNKENIFAIIINVKNISRMKAQQYCSDIITEYQKYSDCEFIYFPSNTEENKIVKLTETDKEIELLF